MNQKRAVLSLDSWLSRADVKQAKPTTPSYRARAGLANPQPPGPALAPFSHRTLSHGLDAPSFWRLIFCYLCIKSLSLYTAEKYSVSCIPHKTFDIVMSFEYLVLITFRNASLIFLNTNLTIFVDIFNILSSSHSYHTSLFENDKTEMNIQ